MLCCEELYEPDMHPLKRLKEMILDFTEWTNPNYESNASRKRRYVIQKRKRACAIAYMESTVVIVIVIFYYLIPLLMPCIRGAPFKSTSKSVYTKKFK